MTHCAEEAVSEAIRQALHQGLSRLGPKKCPLVVPPSIALYDPSQPGNFHPHYEIFIPQSGSTQFECPQRSFKLGPNRLAVIPPGVSHLETVHTAVKSFFTLVIAFDSRSVRFLLCGARTNRRVKVRHSQTHETRDVASLTRLLDTLSDSVRSEAQKQPAYHRALMEAILLKLLAIVCDEAPQTGHGHPLVQAAIEHVRLHISDPLLQVQHIAKEVNCHPDQLSRLFHEKEGVRLNTYILDQRLRLARELLTGSDLSIKQVGYASGFSYPSYFIRKFKEREALTPKAFRENAR